MLLNEDKLDPRVKRTRQLLQSSLMKLMQEKNIHSITVQDITDRVAINRATFYAHFADKYDLLNYTVRDRFQQQLEQRLPPQPTLTEGNLRLLTLTVCDYLGEFAGHCAPARHNSDQMMMTAQVQIHTHEILRDWIQAAAAPGMKADQIGSAAVFTSWAIFGSVLDWISTGRKRNKEQLTEQILTLLLPGLQPYL
jgi:AcrR family transcriptional regulator